MIHEIELEHPCGERRAVPVERFTSRRIVTVRWGLSGLYEIDVVKNSMRAKSVKARQKNPHCLWRVVDIEALRTKVKLHFDGIKISLAKTSYEEHVASMPGRAKH